MKTRTPGSFAAAVTRIKTGLGENAAAAAVDRSASLIRKWSDPDHGAVPSVRQALALDAAFVREALGEPPILRAYEMQLVRWVSRRSETEVDLLRSALAVQAAVGDLSEAISEAMDPDSPAGKEISPGERAEILEVVERLLDKVQYIEEYLT